MDNFHCSSNFHRSSKTPLPPLQFIPANPQPIETNPHPLPPLQFIPANPQPIETNPHPLPNAYTDDWKFWTLIDRILKLRSESKNKKIKYLSLVGKIFY